MLSTDDFEAKDKQVGGLRGPVFLSESGSFYRVIVTGAPSIKLWSLVVARCTYRILQRAYTRDQPVKEI